MSLCRKLEDEKRRMIEDSKKNEKGKELASKKSIMRIATVLTIGVRETPEETAREFSLFMSMFILMPQEFIFVKTLKLFKKGEMPDDVIDELGEHFEKYRTSKSYKFKLDNRTGNYEKENQN